MRLWWFLSPGLYSLALLDELNIFQEQPDPADARRGQPVRDPVRGLSDGHLRDADTRHRPACPTSGRSLALLVASFILLALTTIVFKRLEPNFAKVI